MILVFLAATAAVFFILLLFNVPLAFSIGIGGITFFLITEGLPMGIATQSMVCASYLPEIEINFLNSSTQHTLVAFCQFFTWRSHVFFG